MSFAQSWDFTPGARVILDDMRQCSREYDWLEEPHVSPDGERVAMVAALPDPAFSVAVNGVLARRFTRDTLRDVLESYLIPQEEKTSTVRRGLSFLRGKRAVKK